MNQMSHSLPYCEDVSQWTVEQLAAWLQQINLPDIAEIYLREGIDGYAMSNFAEGEHIAVLNSISLRRRLDFLNMMKKIKNQPKPSEVNGLKTPRLKISKFTENNGRSVAQASGTRRETIVNQKTSYIVKNDSDDVQHFDVSNEDYLVPLPSGPSGGSVMNRKPFKVPKKDRCPTPEMESVVISVKAKDDCNAYEIIQEHPQENFPKSRALRGSSKPPDLPNRNSISFMASPAPTAPLRTHSSYQNQLKQSPKQRISSERKLPSNCHSNRPLSSPPAPPVSKSNDTPDDGTTGLLPQLKVLQLNGSKTVPLHPIYKKLFDKEFFHPVSRSALDQTLTEEGMFVVRPSAHSLHLLTLSVKDKTKIFNIVIRSRDDGQFALGNEKQGEIGFNSIQEIIDYHLREPIKAENGSLLYLRRCPMKKSSNIRRRGEIMAD